MVTRNTAFHLVARSDMPSLKEAARTSKELKELGFSNQKLSINGVFSALDETDSLAKQIQETVLQNLKNLPIALQSLSRKDYPLLPYNILGINTFMNYTLL